MIRRNYGRQNKERGIALLVALFALLLLSAIGMGMMFSANTETNINANFREKQIATYAAMAGVQEAKDRLSSIGDITTPAGLPSTGAPNVIYIINPQNGETVAPWDYNNKYYDTELCHENVLGLTGTNGTQCPAASTSFPSGGGWHATPLDNSSGSYSGAYKLNPPLNYKWIRIQLKANNSTPYPVDGSSNSNQVCWTGTRQIPLPSGYKMDCTPNGTITKINVTNQGSGYNATPNIQIAAPGTGGTLAAATATVANPSGTLTNIVLDNGGQGYTYAPIVTVTGGGGAGATGTATVSALGSGGAIQSLTRNDFGSPNIACWVNGSPPTINLSFAPPSTPGGATATGTAQLTNKYNCITNLTFQGGSCTHHLGANNNITISLGDNNFAATISIKTNGALTQSGPVSITNAGSGLNQGSSTMTLLSNVNIADSAGDSAGCTGIQATAFLGYTLQSVALTAGGSGYTTSPTVNFGGGGTSAQTIGNTPSITALPNGISPGQVTTVTMTSGGSGFSGIPTITFTGGCGTPLVPVPCTPTATAHAVFPGVISAITITSPGSGYTSSPTVIINGGGGTGATATAYVQGGTYYSPVYLLTALGVSPGGARSMVQMEAAPAIRALSLPGALTLDGPNPTFGAPNSNNFMINGTDHPNGYIDPTSGATSPAPAGCDATASSSHPAIGVYDDPNNPTSTSSETTVLTAIPSGTVSTNYPGVQASPDVENVYGALGDQGTTPSGLNSIVSTVSGIPGANIYGGGQTDSTIALGTSTAPVFDVINGDLTLTGNTQGYGILVVTGVLTFKGNFVWNGIVLVIGAGEVDFSGGGGGTINGSVLVAKTKDPTTGATLSQLGSPVLDWSGGGGNGIFYDHCWADAMLSMVPMTVPASSKPLTVLSVKTLTY